MTARRTTFRQSDVARALKAAAAAGMVVGSFAIDQNGRIVVTAKGATTDDTAGNPWDSVANASS